jgi:peptide/nickel transport system permease protein
VSQIAVSPAMGPPVGATLSESGRPARTRSFAGMAWRRFRANGPAVAGLIVVLVMVALALGADVISQRILGHTVYEQNIDGRFLPIGSPGHPLGTDDLGRDTATRLLYGGRVSLGVAGLSILVALVIGSTYGLVAGFRGGVTDGVMMRIVDVILSIPSLFLLLLIASLWRMGPLALAFVIAATSWVSLSRLIRGEVLSARERDYVEAARVIGAPDRQIMFRHILRNVMPVMVVWAGLTVPEFLLAEAALSYLGLGIQPPTPSWGNMLSDSQRVWSQSAALVLLPGLCIYVTVFAINLVGNGLRDALDPRLVD